MIDCLFPTICSDRRVRMPREDRWALEPETGRSTHAATVLEQTVCVTLLCDSLEDDSPHDFREFAPDFARSCVTLVWNRRGNWPVDWQIPAAFQDVVEAVSG